MSDNEHDAFREEVLATIERSAEVYGLSRSAGRVYGTLCFSETPLSIPDLVEETGYAKSTISNITRKLTRLGMIRRRSSQGGGRRVQFVPETDIWFIVQDVLQQHVSREMQTTQRTFEQLLQEYNASDHTELQTEVERMNELVDTYDQIQAVLELAIEHSPEELIEAMEEYDEKKY